MLDQDKLSPMAREIARLSRFAIIERDDAMSGGDRNIVFRDWRGDNETFDLAKELGVAIAHNGSMDGRLTVTIYLQSPASARLGHYDYSGSWDRLVARVRLWNNTKDSADGKRQRA